MTSLKKAGAITFLSQAIIFLLGLVASIILARALGPDSRGKYALVLLIPTVMLKAGTLGIEISNVYFSANRKYMLEDIISNSILLSFFLGLILIVTFIILSNSHYFMIFLENNNIILNQIWFVIALLPVLFLIIFLNKILLGRERIIEFNLVDIMRAGLQVILIVIILLLIKSGLSGALIVYASTNILTAIFIIFILKKYSRLKIDLNIKLLKDSFNYGIKGYFGNLAQFFNYRLDMLLVALFLNTTEVGYYAISVGLAEKLWMVPGVISMLLFPRVSYIKNDKASNLTAKVIRNTLPLIILITVLIALVSRVLIQNLFGYEYLSSIAPFMILLPGIFALSIAKILTSDLAGRGRPEFGTFSSIISLLINIPLNLLLIPKWGIKGAAFSSTIAYIVSTLIVLISFLRISNNSLLNILLLQRNDLKNYKHIIKKIFNKDELKI